MPRSTPALIPLATLALILPACPAPKLPPPTALSVTPGPGPPPKPVRVLRVTASEDLLMGPAAGGGEGDFLVSNDYVAFLWSALGRPTGRIPAGSLVDAGRVGGQDALGSLRFVVGSGDDLDEVTNEMARLETAKSGAARLRVSGRTGRRGDLRVATVYELKPESTVLVIRTEVVNAGDKTLENLALGDEIWWGRTEPYADSIGTPGEALKVPDQVWVAGVGEHVSYAYMSEAGMSFHATHDGGRTRTVLAWVTLPPGAEWTVVRSLSIGSRGDTTSAMAALWRALGKPLGRATVAVREHASVVKIPDAVVEFVGELGAAIGTARTDAAGFVTVTLPGGLYYATARAAGRGSAGETRINVAAGGGVRAAVTTTPFGRLHIEVTEAGSTTPTPARLTVVGIDETLTPILGPPWRAAGAGNVHYTPGTGLLPLPPGRYKLIASRGPEFDLAEQEVEVVADADVHARFELVRMAPTAGYIAADLHLHSEGGDESATSLEDLLLAAAGEGLELIALANPEVAVDAAPYVDMAGVTGRLGVLAGVEVATAQGLIVVIPAPSSGRLLRTADRNLDEALALWRDRAPEATLGLARPRGADGAFTHVTPSAAAHMEFDLIEILSNRDPSTSGTLLNDWFALLDRGATPAAIGVTESRALSMAGVCCARTLIGIGDSVPASTAAAKAALDTLRLTRNAVVTNGPFIALTVEGAPPGSVVRPGVRGKAGRAAKKKSRKSKKRMKKGARPVTIAISVTAAPWVSVSSVVLLERGTVAREWKVPPRPDPVRLRESVERIVTADTWFTVVVRGDEPMSPIIDAGGPPDRALPFAVTNPVFVDMDGDGVFSP